MRRSAGVALICAAFLVGLAGCGSDQGTVTGVAPGQERGAGKDPGSGRIGTVRFTHDLKGAVVPGPIIADDGSVLAAGNGGVLYALDPATGRERWTFDGGGSYGIDLSTSPLQLPDKTILWPGPRDRIFALSSAGKLLWSIDVGAMALTPARGPDGTVYVQDMSGTLHALDASRRSGHERWRLPTGAGTSYGSAAISRDGTVYTTVGRDLVAVRDRGDRGTVAWRFAAQADVEVSPAVAPDGTVVLGTNDKYQYGIGPDGKERWRWQRDVFTYSSPRTTPDGLVRFGDHRGRLVTLDAHTGRLKRIDRGHGQVWGAPAVAADGSVAFSGHPGEVFVVDARGRRVLHVTTGGAIDSSPTFGPDGTLYIGSEDGRLYALTPRR